MSQNVFGKYGTWFAVVGFALLMIGVVSVSLIGVGSKLQWAGYGFLGLAAILTKI